MELSSDNYKVFGDRLLYDSCHTTRQKSRDAF
jgi:hypothetical protein